jgi:hypothetical protein
MKLFCFLGLSVKANWFLQISMHKLCKILMFQKSKIRDNVWTLKQNTSAQEQVFFVQVAVGSMGRIAFWFCESTARPRAGKSEWCPPPLFIAVDWLAPCVSSFATSTCVFTVLLSSAIEPCCNLLQYSVAKGETTETNDRRDFFIACREVYIQVFPRGVSLGNNCPWKD